MWRHQSGNKHIYWLNVTVWGSSISCRRERTGQLFRRRFWWSHVSQGWFCCPWERGKCDDMCNVCMYVRNRRWWEFMADGWLFTFQVYCHGLHAALLKLGYGTGMETLSCEKGIEHLLFAIVTLQGMCMISVMHVGERRIISSHAYTCTDTKNPTVVGDKAIQDSYNLTEIHMYDWLMLLSHTNRLRDPPAAKTRSNATSNHPVSCNGASYAQKAQRKGTAGMLYVNVNLRVHHILIGREGARKRGSEFKIQRVGKREEGRARKREEGQNAPSNEVCWMYIVMKCIRQTRNNKFLKVFHIMTVWASKKVAKIFCHGKWISMHIHETDD